MNSFMFNTLVFIALLGFCTSIPSGTIEDTSNGHVKTLKYQNSVGEIVKDLITSWNSPILYLKNRGYLTEPRIDFDMFRKDVGKEESKDAQKPRRMAGSSEHESTNDLGHLFRSLFSSNDKSISDNINSRLGVAWDMDKLKTSVHNEAHKFYEAFSNKRNDQVPIKQELEENTDIDKPAAELYPSVIPNPSNDHTEKEERKESFEPTPYKETKLLNGIAKLLTNRELKGKARQKKVVGENPRTQ